MTKPDRDTYPDSPVTYAPAGFPASNRECAETSQLPREISGLLDARRPDDAEQALARWCGSAGTAVDEMRRRLLGAYALLRIGRRNAGLEHLRSAFAMGRESGGLRNMAAGARDLLSVLCAEALEAGIEPCFARTLIDREKLPPPFPNSAHWPYPVRIYTLGRFTVVARGQPLRFSGKAQRRPMFLMHSLLAQGGKPVPVNRLRKAMGEDDTFGDSRYTRGAFDMALSRLRHLLSVPDLLLLGEGMLSLNGDLCWVDAWAVEHLLLDAEQQPNPAYGMKLLERALSFHEGEFLAGDESAGAVLARERMRSRLLRVSRRLGVALEEAGRWEEAGALYERVREVFPLDEDICLRLIRSHIKRQEFAQATGIYARCRELLAKVLGTLPSPAMRALIEPSRLQA